MDNRRWGWAELASAIGSNGIGYTTRCCRSVAEIKQKLNQIDTGGILSLTEPERANYYKLYRIMRLDRSLSLNG